MSKNTRFEYRDATPDNAQDSARLRLLADVLEGIAKGLDGTSHVTRPTACECMGRAQDDLDEICHRLRSWGTK